MQPVWFRIADVQGLIDEALRATEHQPVNADFEDEALIRTNERIGEEATSASSPDAGIDTKRVRPRILLIHDLSVYLTSSALHEDRRTVFAEGLDPDRNPRWADEARAAVGINDFTEPFEIEALQQLCAAQPSGWLCIELGEDALRLTAMKEKAA